MTQRHLFFSILTVSLLIAPSSTSQSKGKQIWEPRLLTSLTDATPKPSVANEIVSGFELASMKITLEETELSDVQRRFGGTIGHRGDAAGFLAWLCYSIPTDKGPSALWLLSDEIDGGTVVGGFQWASLTESDSLDPRCARLPKSAFHMNVPVNLTTTAAEAMRSLGQPSATRHDVIEYVHERELSIRGETYILTNTLYLLMRDEVVKSIEVWHSTVS